MPDRKPERLVADVMRSLEDKQRIALLRYLLIEWVRSEQRQEARRVERRSYREDTAWWRKHQKEVARIRVEEPEEYRRRFTIGGVIETFEREIRDEIRLELTAELLATTFALGDGRMVTWADATVADHHQRLQVLGQNVLGNLTTMTLHEQAIDMLASVGCATLAEVPAGAVAA
jgi:flagellar biosynthesis GTPase FlhF